jgi:hypothetical protein
LRNPLSWWYGFPSVVLPYHLRRLKLVASQQKLGDCTSSTSPTIEGSGKPAKISKKKQEKLKITLANADKYSIMKE